MDRFFRGIGNRLRGTPEVTPDAREISQDIPRAAPVQVPANAVAAEDTDTEAEAQVDESTHEDVPEPTAEGEDQDDVAEPTAEDEDQDDDSGSEDTPPEDDDDSLTLTAGDDDGTTTSGTDDDSDDTITFESGDGDTITLEDGGDDGVTVGTGDDGSTIVWVDGDGSLEAAPDDEPRGSDTAEDEDSADDEADEEPAAGVDVVVYPEPDPEPEPDPDPAPDPEPEPQPEPDDDQESDTVRTIDLGDLDLTGRDFSDFRRGESSGTDSTAQVPIADLSPEDLRVQPEVASGANLAEYLNTDEDDEDDEDDDQVEVSKDELIDKPVVEHQPAPGTGLPIPLPNSADSLDVMAEATESSPAAEQPAELVEPLGDESLLSPEQPQEGAPETLQMAGDSEAGEPSKTVDGQEAGTNLVGDEIAWVVADDNQKTEQFESFTATDDLTKLSDDTRVDLEFVPAEATDMEAAGKLEFKNAGGNYNNGQVVEEPEPVEPILMSDERSGDVTLEAVELVPPIVSSIEDQSTPEMSDGDDDDGLDGL